MNANQKENVVDIIDSVRDLSAFADIKLADLPALKSRVMVQLSRIDSFLSAVSGTKPMPRPESKKFGPIPMHKASAPAEPIEPKTQMQLEAEALKAEAEEIYPDFVNRDTDELLDSVTDIVLRVVAKKAGLQVTETDPENIDAAFIEQIKEKIKTDAAFQELTGQGKPAEENPELTDQDKSSDAEQNPELADLTVVKEEYEKMLAEAVKAKGETKDKNEKKELTERIKQLEEDLQQTNAQIESLTKSAEQ